MKKHNLKRQQGFTLNEVLMSAAIMGIFLVSYMVMDSRNWLATEKNRNMLVAGHMVEQYMENMRMRIAQDTAANFPPTDTSYTQKDLTLTSTIETALSPKDDAVIANLRKATILVEWGNNAGDSLEVVTYIARDF